MKPKEHGAYAILAIPIVTAWVVGGFTIVGLLVALASVAGFLAHEPLLVSWGHRGGRALTASPTAHRRLLILLAVATLSGTAALAIGSQTVQLALIGCFALAVVSFLVALSGTHRSLAGQLWGVVGLSAPSVPILLAGGVELRSTLAIWFVWLLGFTSTTVAVRGVIAAQKRQSRVVLWLILIGVSLSVTICVISRFYESLTILPMLAPSWYLMLFPPHARYLKRVGWTLVAGTVTTGVLIAFCF